MSSSLGLVGAADGTLAMGAGAGGCTAGLRSQRVTPMPAINTKRTTAYFALFDLGAGRDGSKECSSREGLNRMGCPHVHRAKGHQV